LLITEHPVSIHKHEKRGPLEHLQAVSDELIVKSRRLLHVIGNNNSLTDVLIQKVESSYWKEKWHTNTVHHSDVDNVKHIGKLEMDNIVFATVEELELCH
jgi:hypothetical protein